MSAGARIKISDQESFEIMDPDNVRPVYADLVTEIRLLGGVLHLSLATALIDGDEAGITKTARVCAGLRIGASTLQFIQQALAAPNETPKGQTIN